MPHAPIFAPEEPALSEGPPPPVTLSERRNSAASRRVSAVSRGTVLVC
jgi:hypothetical protein